MAAQKLRETTVSAPGKVLIAGGYLVLDPTYPGLVISTSSRFYCHAQSQSSSSAASQEANTSNCLITVKSPQFVDAVWVYRASSVLETSAAGGEPKQEWIIEQTSESQAKAGRNPFVSLALAYTFDWQQS